MENSASAVVEQQQQATSQKSKKKSKNRRQAGKCANSSSPTVDGHQKSTTIAAKSNQKEAVASPAIVENGHSEKLGQSLHIASDGHQMNGIAENSSAHAHNPTHAHAKQNGHHAPAETSNGTCQTQSTATTEGGKKSKSKSNKPKNKETILYCHSDGELVEEAVDNVQSQGNLQVKISCDGTAEATKMTTVAAVEAATKHLENGFSHDSDNSGAAGSKHIENTDSDTAEQSDQTQASNSKTDNYSNKCTERCQKEESTANTACKVSPTCQGQSKEATAITTENANTQDKTAASANPITAKPNVAATSATVSVSEVTEKESLILLEPALDLSNVRIEYKEYESELQMHDIMRLIQAELSEPYSIYTYRYFIYNWPKLCFLAAHGSEYVGAIVCKLDMHMNVRRGYIAMLAVRKEYRKLKIGTTLVQKAIEAMLADNADEVVLETEMRNVPALRLYENLGFVRDKRLFRYYLNGVDALRLKLWFR